ncbi:predicted protein [Chaetomium globosum CBS 148.51]|uniref:Uncharacterized protein n=1 Tax=Chaetomium globosum (strain ATCC 6205 / CBS 148.51 / DSM 1962 / NBRC 6347 / NRRL 1970) TaxID=306901 RepID=Q2GZA6_CHAGB|nr:uncharacterized protein CHGG_05140 [Chaetomium globosum CBS 148.51]EAQ88521.1 predicted protein [Chaetomium globosum CBS 148.51]
MSSPKEHPLACPEVIRWLVDSQCISEEDLLELARTNKAISKLVLQESMRNKIKNIPFKDPDNPIHQAIMVDRPNLLQEALDLGEFEPREQAMTSPNGRRLMDETAHDLFERPLTAVQNRAPSRHRQAPSPISHLPAPQRRQQQPQPQHPVISVLRPF